MSLFMDVMNGNTPEINTDEIVTESTDDILSDDELMTEAVYPDTLPYMETKIRRITLPKGKPDGYGNLCFLYTNNTNESIQIMNNKINFVNANKYFFYFYNMIYRGKLYNKVYRFRLYNERKALYKQINTKVKHIKPFLKLAITPKDSRNMYYDLSKYIEIFNSICTKLIPIKMIEIYWNYIKAILFADNLKGYSNKFVLLNIENFRLYDTLKENLTNPVFLLYYTMYRKPELLKDINIDYYLYCNNRCLRVNPSQTDKKTYIRFRTEMKRLYSYAKTPQTNTDDILNEENIDRDEAKEEIVTNITSNINITNVISTPTTVSNKPELEKVKKDLTNSTTSSNLTHNNKKETFVVKPSLLQKSVISSPVLTNHIRNKIMQKATNVQKQVISKAIELKVNTPENKDKINTIIQKKVEEDIDKDKELLSQIYDNTVADLVPKSAASTARDRELQKAQENIKVGNLTIKEIEKMQTSHIPIPSKDVSTSVRTTNKEMTKLTFHNFEKTYNDTLMNKDLVNAILSLNDKSIPMYVRDIRIKDTSDELNYKDTYTILLEDANRKRHTINVDIPKFIEDRFLYLGGSKKLIKKQNLLYPVVKTDSDIVQITTNYNKMFIQRVGTKSIASIERLKIALKKSDEFKSDFKFGNTLSANSNYITTIEYDELSRFITEFKSGKTHLFFSQIEAEANAKEKDINIPKGHMFIGYGNNGRPIFINTTTQKTDDKKSIVDIILESVNSELLDAYNSAKSPKRLMYAKVKVMDQFVSVGLLLGFWEGLTSILKKGKVKYRLEDNKPEIGTNESVLKFADCYLVYESNVGIDLLLNGFGFIDLSKYDIAQMDERETYMDYLIKVYGKSTIANALLNAYEFTIDPITKEVLEDMNLPTDLVELIIYAVSLLADSQYTPEINQGLSRIRCNEIIPAILYDCIAKKYILYRNSNGRKPFSVPKDCVIKSLLAVKTVEDYSTLNPVLEMEMIHGISSKGFRGANLDDSYTMAKRTYDKTNIGVISPSTSPDGSVGVNKTLTLNPSVTSLRGYVDLKNNKLGELHDINLFSPGELSIPLCATNDDATRLGHAIKQSKHVIPVKNSSPVLISNGFEEVCRFDLSSDFVVNAEMNGKVIEYDEATKIMIVEYKDGSHKAINLGKTIVKNGGGGFFLSNQLITPYKVGDTFKKDDVLAYHKDFFTNDRFNNCRMNMGTLTKVAIMSTYNTYQDATMITEKLSEEAATEMCFLRQVSIGKNSNIEYMVKVGDEIKVGDSLIQFDTSYEDNSLNALLANLGEDEKENVLEGSKNDIHSKYSGVIEDIKIYSTVDLDEMSPSLKSIVSAYYNKINKKKRLLEKYDPESKNSIVKCGLLMNETTHKIEPNKFGVIKGQKIEDGVMIEFYIKHSEPLEIGSKIANFTALKNTIGEIIPAGYEPWSDFRPNEEISTIIASNSILKRMTPSILLTALGNKCVIELKNRLREIYNEK